MFEPPYGIIWNRWKEGKVIPFLGAGASLVGRSHDEKWSPNELVFLPSGLELAHHLAFEASFPSSDSRDLDDLSKVSSYFVEVSTRQILRDTLRELLNKNYKIGSLHKFIAKVDSNQLIVVTNYDTLLEQAFQSLGKPYDLVIYPADRKDIGSAVLWWPHGSSEPLVEMPNELDIDLDNTTVIYKMHGTVIPESSEWDNFVITEEDYVEFLSRMTTNSAIPAIFFEYSLERSFLFLGYSLRDWNLRVVLRNLNRQLLYRRKHKGASQEDDEMMASWAIQRDPSELERKLWDKRRVTIFDLALDDFVHKMIERRGY